MTDVAKQISLERALELLRDGPLSGEEICRRVLALENLPAALAEPLCRSMLGADPRFLALGDGTWALSGFSPAGPELCLREATYVVVDVETTGFSPPADRVIEIGCVKVREGRVVEEFETLINPRRPIPGPITSLTGISPSMLVDQPTFSEVCGGFLEFLGGAVFVAHNAPFDWRFIQSEVALAEGRTLLNHRLCTRAMARRLLPEISRYSLDELARFFNLEFTLRHRALGDALVTAEVLLRFIERAAERGIANLAGLIELLKPAGRRKS
jgi:DNA polymerase III epsilon subunit family exonuclease